MIPITDFSGSNEECAIAIGISYNSFTHCGILYKIDGNSFFLHLGSPVAFHNSPENNYLEYNSAFKWCSFNNVPKEAIGMLRTQCALIAGNKDNSNIEYGLFYENNSYFDNKGKFHLGDSSGLTCSSFVITTLKSAGIIIIDDSDWPDGRTGDMKWVSDIRAEYFKAIENHKKASKKAQEDLDKEKNPFIQVQLQSRISEMEVKITKFQNFIDECNEAKKEKWIIRFRPEEIAGTSYHNFDELPLMFFDKKDKTKPCAKILGEEVLKKLKT